MDHADESSGQSASLFNMVNDAITPRPWMNDHPVESGGGENVRYSATEIWGGPRSLLPADRSRRKKTSWLAPAGASNIPSFETVCSARMAVPGMFVTITPLKMNGRLSALENRAASRNPTASTPDRGSRAPCWTKPGRHSRSDLEDGSYFWNKGRSASMGGHAGKPPDAYRRSSSRTFQKFKERQYPSSLE